GMGTTSLQPRHAAGVAPGGRMKVTLESTDRIVELELQGAIVPARVWIGRTQKGIECHAFVTRIAVGRQDDASQFERDLREQHVPLPAPLARAIPLRLVL